MQQEELEESECRARAHPGEVVVDGGRVLEAFVQQAGHLLIVENHILRRRQLPGKQRRPSRSSLLAMSM